MASIARRCTLLAIAGLLAACKVGGAPSDEISLLEAAGFERMAASSAAQQESLGQLPHGQIVAIQRPSGVRYLVADPGGCGCLFVGDAQDLEGFRRLTQAEALAVSLDQQSAARWSTTYGEAWGGDW